MKQKILEFLQQRGGTASAGAIVKQVLRMPMVGSQAAHRLLSRMLADDPRFHSDGLGNWYLVAESLQAASPQSLPPAPFWVMATAPERGHPAEFREVQLAVVEVSEGGLGNARHFIWTRENSPQLRVAWQQFVEAVSPASILVAERPMQVRAVLHHFALKLGEALPPLQELHLLHFGQNLLQWPKRPTVAELREALGLPALADAEDLERKVKDLAECFLQLLQRVPETAREAEQLLQLGRRPSRAVDFSAFQFDEDSVRSLPETPGVYCMRNAKGKIVYVGKAANLRRRVGQYFLQQQEAEEKLARILAEVKSIDWTATDTELDALLLEARWIRKHRPAINRQIQIFSRATPQIGESCRILILLSALSEIAVLFLLSPSGSYRRIRVPEQRKPRKRLLAAIRELAFATHPVEPASATEKMECELAWRWYFEHREQVNAIDAADFSSAEECFAAVEFFIDDFDRIRRKMILRGT